MSRDVIEIQPCTIREVRVICNLFYLSEVNQLFQDMIVMMEGLEIVFHLISTSRRELWSEESLIVP